MEQERKYAFCVSCGEVLYKDGTVNNDGTYMNPATGSTGKYDDWWYENEAGEEINAVDAEEVIAIGTEEVWLLGSIDDLTDNEYKNLPKIACGCNY